MDTEFWIAGSILGTGQLIIAGLLKALYTSRNTALETIQTKLGEEIKDRTALDARMSHLEGYIERQTTDSKETRDDLKYLTKRLDELSSKVLTKDDLTTTLKSLMFAIKNAD